MSKIDWIAIFDGDFQSKVFTEPGKSEAVLFWVKRYEDGRIHQPTTTNSIHALRSFEFYDSQFNQTVIQIEEYSWKCSYLKEVHLDGWGSDCRIGIIDNKGIEIEVSMNGRTDYKWNGSIDYNLYPICLMFFLELLSKHDNWDDIKKQGKSLYKKLSNRVPKKIYKYVSHREFLATHESGKFKIQKKAR